MGIKLLLGASLIAVITAAKLDALPEINTTMPSVDSSSSEQVEKYASEMRLY